MVYKRLAGNLHRWGSRETLYDGFEWGFIKCVWGTSKEGVEKELTYGIERDHRV